MEIVKTCDLSKNVIIKFFKLLNDEDVILKSRNDVLTIVTDKDPNQLVYPEDWYYNKGCLRNKHTNTNGLFDEIPMKKN